MLGGVDGDDLVVVVVDLVDAFHVTPGSVGGHGMLAAFGALVLAPVVPRLERG